jgi:hypothetical protein
MNNRYYSALFGRFISPDPLDYIDGMNVYAYVNGNVVNFLDPYGLISLADALANDDRVDVNEAKELELTRGETLGIIRNFGNSEEQYFTAGEIRDNSFIGKAGIISALFGTETTRIWGREKLINRARENNPKASDDEIYQAVADSLNIRWARDLVLRQTNPRFRATVGLGTLAADVLEYIAPIPTGAGVVRITKSGIRLIRGTKATEEALETTIAAARQGRNLKKVGTLRPIDFDKKFLKNDPDLLRVWNGVHEDLTMAGKNNAYSRFVDKLNKGESVGADEARKAFEYIRQKFLKEARKRGYKNIDTIHHWEWPMKDVPEHAVNPEHLVPSDTKTHVRMHQEATDGPHPYKDPVGDEHRILNQ